MEYLVYISVFVLGDADACVPEPTDVHAGAMRITTTVALRV